MVHRQDQVEMILRHVDSLSSKYKKAPVRFRIEPAPQYCNQDGQLTCSPGALFEGTVLVQLSEPLAAVQLKLAFKLSEMLNYDAIAWGKRIVEDRIFNVRTVLWGHPSHDTESVRNWPVMEPGYHLFPFTCAMPNVNYPPSALNNTLVYYAFHIVATLDRPGLRPFQTEPCVVSFQPKIPIPPTLALASSTTSFKEEKQLGPISVAVRVPTTTYHIGDILRVAIRASDLIFATVSLEQHFKVTTSAFHSTKTIVLKHVQRRMETGEFLILLNEEDGVSPSFEYGRQVDMRYSVKIVVKCKQNTLQTKKKTFLVPVFIATASAAEVALEDELLLPYTDDVVVSDNTLLTKPKFLRHQTEPLPLLPPYDAADCPPGYCAEEAD
ncbi:hypothetical protein BDB00DRAFT_403929 [Zychaea mexicana]|uniref:uncharacterized protein n=1 Tax=Zychaea mexicana TaxID=64656 RepID=UPI0022FE7FDF|nr:uncharacterized protein BDB00DRAFT_403929 [Zychaea mexicana]KAI9498806.1 hypothetical protein BDB00DRAFT_403929 [Zychaea mexicana]